MAEVAAALRLAVAMLATSRLATSNRRVTKSVSTTCDVSRAQPTGLLAVTFRWARSRCSRRAATVEGVLDLAVPSDDLVKSLATPPGPGLLLSGRTQLMRLGMSQEPPLPPPPPRALTRRCNTRTEMLIDL